MTREFTGLHPERIRDNLERVRERIAATGRDPADVEILAAIKYVSADALPALAQGGIELVGELAAEHGLARLSMGTSQDYAVAVQEGATIIRLGSVLYE